MLLHGDLHLDHLLLDESGRVSAVIDWTDASSGDPACDFDLLYANCGEPFVRAMLDVYDGPDDAGLLDRIRLQARWCVLQWVTRAVEREPEALPRCRAAFDRVFP